MDDLTEKAETEELVFCETCGCRRVRDVKGDLQRLFTEKSLKPGICGICCRPLDWIEEQKLTDSSRSHRRPRSKSLMKQKNIVAMPSTKSQRKQSVSVSIKSKAVLKNTIDSDNTKVVEIKKEPQPDDDDVYEDVDFSTYDDDDDDSDDDDSDDNSEEDERMKKEKEVPKLVIRFSPRKSTSNAVAPTVGQKEQGESSISASVISESNRDSDEDIDDEVKELMQMEEDPQAVESEIIEEVDEKEDEKDTSDHLKFVDPRLLEFLNTTDNQKQSYKCNLCKVRNAEFQHLATFAAHVSKHTGMPAIDKPYRCFECAENFTAKGYYVHQISHKNASKKYKCLYMKCKYVFQKRSTLRSHLELHRGLRRQLCKTCGGGFQNKKELKVHSLIHSDEKTFFCKYCDRGFSLETSRRTHEMHSHEKKDRYKCDECHDFTCPTPSRLLAHKKIHRLNFDCERCGQVFREKAKLDHHVQLDMCEDSEEPDIKDFTQGVDERLVALMDKPRRKDKPFKCKYCVLNEFRSPNKFLEHMKEKHPDVECPVTLPYKCNLCDAAFAKRQYIDTHSYSHVHLRPHTCDYEGCDKTFKSKHGLHVHKLIHEGRIKPKPKDKQLMCTICGSRMSTMSQLKEHEQCVHFDIKPFKCPHCGLRSGTLSKQNKHINTVHLNMRPWVCDTCGKSFKNKYELTAHTYTHTGEKPYGCDRCEYRCVRRDYLRKHKRIHSGEKPYRCKDCGKMFTQRQTMVGHMRKEHGYYEALPSGGRPREARTLPLEANESTLSSHTSFSMESNFLTESNVSHSSSLL
ncbi:uncharacterized protein [Amphiura filiformis]|uniref:uncharacterized protein n=1 Tax=Amphiura filiformis TaxID=82378 RepID=UPI003B21C255